MRVDQSGLDDFLLCVSSVALLGRNYILSWIGVSGTLHDGPKMIRSAGIGHLKPDVRQKS